MPDEKTILVADCWLHGATGDHSATVGLLVHKSLWYSASVSGALYFLEQLRRAGVPQQQLLHFYTAVIRPVLEYASPVWHYSIARGMSYPNVLFVANLYSLSDRRDKLLRTFFQNMCKPASCLHHLPPPRNTSPISRLRSSIPLPRPTSRTKKFQSFVNFALNKYQSPL